MSSPYSQFNDSVIDEFRANDGTVARFGRSLVLVHHTGAKSGIERIAPTMAIPAGADAWFIAASKAGADENPAWYHNLLAHPETSIEVPGEGLVAVTVSELEGAQRDEAWKRFTSASEGFRQYEQRTSRTIPVLKLTRR